VIRADRLVLGGFAAGLLAWGLVGAPIHHQLVRHQHTPVLWQPKSLPLKSAKAKAKKKAAPTHQHGAPGRPDHDHGAQSLEHGKVALTTAPAVPELHLVLAALTLPEAPEQHAPDLFERHQSEQPQGP
jgi:hypothetical protein